jgi:hypothetical protein
MLATFIGENVYSPSKVTDERSGVIFRNDAVPAREK